MTMIGVQITTENEPKLLKTLRNFNKELISESLEDTKVIQILLNRMESFGERPAISTRYRDSWEGLNYLQLVKKAKTLASYFMDYGLDHSKKVVILSESINEYPISLMALALTGAVIIPLDNKLSPNEIVNILNHCEPDLALTSTDYYLKMNDSCKMFEKELPLLLLDNKTEGLMSVFDLAEGAEIRDTYPERKLDETLIISYTSGTTGNPKGVMLTPRNITFQIEALALNFDVSKARFLSILPMNHMFELTGGVLSILSHGGEIFCGRTLLPTQLVEILKEKKITNMQCVPLILEAFKNAIFRKISKEPKLKQKIFKAMLKTSHAMNKKMKKKVFKNIHEAFGGHFQYFISGGAPLNAETYAFWKAVGIDVYEGYGLTETSPVLTVNPYTKSKKGSVGVAVYGTELKIEKKSSTDRSGLIFAKGPQVMKGYYKNQELTDELIDKDGWFKTGDIGYIDEEGYLFITGREKNLIVLGGGKKVHSEEVEKVISNIDALAECAVLPRKTERGEEVVAIVVPNEEIKLQFKDKEQCRAYLVDQISKNRSKLADYKWPKEFIISMDELPRTTTKKVKRNELTQFLQ